MIKILAILVLAVAAFLARPTAEAHQFFKLDRPAHEFQAQAEVQPIQQTKAITEAQVQPESKPAETPPPPPPVTCKADQWVRADNGQCLDKPKLADTSEGGGFVATAGSGSCAEEIAKYDWTQSVALAVARAESGLNPGIVNNNPRTRDYSIGCFQINIYGANARSRPSEAALKDAATNVRFAYGIYTSNGNSFIGQWGVCRGHVRCY